MALLLLKDHMIVTSEKKHCICVGILQTLQLTVITLCALFNPPLTHTHSHKACNLSHIVKLLKLQ